MSKEQGGPAFPVHPGMASALGCIPSSTDAGMSLRDYFAAKAMQGILSAGRDPQYGGQSMSDLANASYEIADHMLEARK